ncbi:GNAT family N-acetyltransferase [Rhodococcoides kyotonense]|uniref:ElaA protein n=1 Tax=Rhodococcoides kyotonense TaxID=398843 RepID=A0A239DVR1_9NOCA|nr:GNAT family N-acetyltransferase [Rhodococcus kyotonensis]SNS36417.1 ElaA protein [Rhodococcus kyotonensis]
MSQLHHAPFADLSGHEVYSLCRLRVDVFVVEQNCAYPELDGADEDDGTIHFWHSEDDRIVSTLRLMRRNGETRIGRVCTAEDARGRGLSAQLMQAAIEQAATETIVIGAQTQLEKWYGGFGFVRSGPDYDEDGIPHLPMLRTPE